MLGIRKRKTEAPKPEEGGQAETEATYLVADKKTRRAGNPLRVVGNVLIALGLLIMLGIGGWYLYNQWSNQQFIDQVKQEFGQQAYEPPVDATPVPTTPPAPTPLPNLSFGMANVVSRVPKQADNSAPMRLVIPSVNIDSKVVTVTWQMLPAPGGGMKSEWNVADYAVGHHIGSANPGQPGNVVMSGHVDYRGQVFKDLHNVKKGDEVIVYTDKGQYIYVVTNMVIVQEDGASDAQKRRNAHYMDPTPDPTLTMITCYPYAIDNDRLIVIAKPYQSSLSAQSEFTIR